MRALWDTPLILVWPHLCLDVLQQELTELQGFGQLLLGHLALALPDLLQSLRDAGDMTLNTTEPLRTVGE